MGGSVEHLNPSLLPLVAQGVADPEHQISPVHHLFKWAFVEIISDQFKHTQKIEHTTSLHLHVQVPMCSRLRECSVRLHELEL